MTNLKVKKYYVGWDVGGWNCDKNPNSRDAISILDENLKLVGKPWRGNLKSIFNNALSQTDLIKSLFALCQVQSELGTQTNQNIHLYFGIDTPLGFSDEFRQLLTNPARFLSAIDGYADNAYVFRQTDRYLFSLGLKPLSPINDMIGSQATKGIHFLNKFIGVAPIAKGVWSREQFTAIEAYPSACKKSQLIHSLLQAFREKAEIEALPHKLPEIDSFQEAIFHEDVRDSLVCALIAYLFNQKPQTLIQPMLETSSQEGWIFAPQDNFLDNFH